MIEGKIRVITLGIVRNNNGTILFDSMRDPKRDLEFLRPIGGGVDFAESCKDAIAREFKEELSAEVNDCELIEVFENIFEYNGKPGHEIVFLYDVKLADKQLYDQMEIPVKEGSENRVAKWYSKDDIKKSVILPPQILDLI